MRCPICGKVVCEHSDLEKTAFGLSAPRQPYSPPMVEVITIRDLTISVLELSRSVEEMARKNKREVDVLARALRTAADLVEKCHHEAAKLKAQAEKLAAYRNV